MISLESLNALLKQGAANRDSFANSNRGLNALNADMQGRAIANQNVSAWDTPIPYATTSSAPDAPEHVGGFGSFAGGWNGPVNNPIGRFVGANSILDILGHGVQTAYDKTGLNHVVGAMQGGANAWLGSPKDQGGKDPITSVLDAYLAAPKRVLHGISEGFKHPDQAAETGQKMIDSDQTPVFHWLNNFLYHAGTDPLTYTPVGAIGKGITKVGAEGIGRIPKINEAISNITKQKAGEYFDANSPRPVRPEPMAPPVDDGFVNEGYVPKEKPPAPPARMTPEEQLNKVMEMLNPEINKMKTDPLNMRRGQKIDFLAKEMGATPEEILQSWSKKNQIDNAVKDIVDNKPHSAYEQMAADKLGFNLDDILNGKLDPRFEPKAIPTPETRFTMGSIVPFQGEHIPLGQTAAEAAHGVNRAGFIDNVMNNSTAGSRLRNELSDRFKGSVSQPIAERLSKMGIGSGINAMPESVRNYVLNNRAEMEAGIGKLDAFSQTLAKKISDMGITKTQLSEMRHAHETGVEITDPKLRAVRDLIVKATNEGIDGVKAGLKHETDHGLAPKDLRENYMHLSTETPSWFKGMKKKEKGTITQGYTKDRVYNTAAEAEADGHIVRDPISSMLDRLIESNKDISNYSLYKGILDMGDKEAGIISKNAAPGFKKFNSEVPNNPLNGKYVNESVHRYLKELERVPVAQQKGILPTVLKGFDKANSLYRNATLYNPMVHNHNTFGNFFVSAGAGIDDFREARNLLTGKGKVSPEMQTSAHWAEKTGALGNDSHYNRFKTVDRLLDGKKASTPMKRFQDKGLWEPEKQQRLALFHKERMENLDKGMSEETAANKARDAVNKHLGDYTTNNLSKFEREVMQRLDPYYKWHKSNYPLQIKNLFNPDVMRRRAVAEHAMNTTNYSMSGHDQKDNIGSEKEKRKLHLALGDGKYASIDPYVPWQESNKMLEEGAGNFLWNRLHPLLKTLELQRLNEKYVPSKTQSPDDMDLSNKPIVGNLDTTGQALGKRFTAAADNLAPSYIKNLTEKFGLPIGRAENPNNPNIEPLLRMLIGSTGAFVNPAPTSQEKVDMNERMSNKAKQDELRKYMIEQMKKKGRD